MRIGGFYYKNSERIQLELVDSPDEFTVLNMLKIMEDKSGILNLKQNSKNDFGSNKLSLHAENGHYLIIYGCYQDDGDYLVLTLEDKNDVKKGKLMSILGEPYPATAVVEDFSIVKKVFIDFLLTGIPGEELKA